MSIEYFLKLLRRYLYVPLVFVLVGLGGAAAYTSVRGGFETSALVLVTPPASVADRVSSHPERFVLTQEKVVTSDQVVRAAAGILGDTSPEDLEAVISVQGGVEDDTMTITSRGDTKAQSRQRVDAVAEAYTQASPKIGITTLRIEAATAAVSRARVFFAGCVGGVALGVLALLGVGFLRRPVLDTDGWVGGEPIGSVFPYRINTRRRDHKERAEDELMNWLVKPGANSGRAAHSVLLHGVPGSSEAARLANWLEASATRVGLPLTASDDDSHLSHDEPAEGSRLADHAATDGGGLNLVVWHPGLTSARMTDAMTRVMVVSQGTPLRSLENALKLFAPGTVGRVVVID